uniref:(northern house mosquito) hypothetical protein n=1 Tax=Culex pipiens TaxID=7175 RepID=A0A8D8BV22_CULPI
MVMLRSLAQYFLLSRQQRRVAFLCLRSTTRDGRRATGLRERTPTQGTAHAPKNCAQERRLHARRLLQRPHDRTAIESLGGAPNKTKNTKNSTEPNSKNRVSRKC